MSDVVQQIEMQQPGRTRDWRPLFFLISVCIIVLDRVTKLWIRQHIAEGRILTVIPHVFWLSHVLNEGAAFSMFNDAPANPTRWTLTFFSVLVALFVAVLLVRMGRRFSVTGLGLALVLGGAIGNAWDRIQYKMVTDFLYVQIYHYHWPDFNVADSAIVIGGILLLAGALFIPPRTPTS